MTFTFVIFAIVTLNYCFTITIAWEWNFAVASGSEIMFYDQNWDFLTNLSHLGDQRILTLNVDNEDNIVVIGNPGEVLYFHLENDTRNKGLEIDEIVHGTMNHGADSITFDPVEKTYYWTDSESKTIFKAHLNDAGNQFASNEFMKFENKIPHGIAFDVCGRSLYWSNRNRGTLSIEKIDLASPTASHTVIPTEKLTYPLGIYVEQTAGRIFWIDGTTDDYFSIESANLDGSNHKIILKDIGQKPHSLTVDENYVYWTDHRNHQVWSIAKKGKSQPIKKTSLKSTPRGIVINKRISANDIQRTCDSELRISYNFSTCEDYCFNNAECEQINRNAHCKCKHGYEGLRCDVRTCVNYCRNSGLCRIEDNEPVCDCLAAFQGSQCEHVTNATHCYNYCLNGGECVFDEITHVTSCECDEHFTGKRCEINKCAGFCQNNGTCHINKYEPVCRCPAKFVGEQCEIASHDDFRASFLCPDLGYESNDKYFAQILLICGATVITHILFVLCFFFGGKLINKVTPKMNRYGIVRAFMKMQNNSDDVERINKIDESHISYNNSASFEIHL